MADPVKDAKKAFGATGPMVPPRADYKPATNTKKVDTFGDTISQMSGEAFTNALNKVVNAGDIQIDPNDPRLLTAFKQANQYISDLAVGGLYTIEGATQAAAGAIGEVFGGSPNNERKLANDIMGMGDAFAGSGVARGANLLDDFLETGSTAVLRAKPIQKIKTPDTNSAVPSTLESPPMETEVFDLFEPPKMGPSEWFDNQFEVLKEDLKTAGPSLQESYSSKIKAIETLGKDKLLGLAENIPHFNDPSYKDYLKGLESVAGGLGVYPPNFIELLNDLSVAYPKKLDPGRQDLTDVNLPLRSTVGERAATTAKNRPSDKAAEDLGFKDTVYHTTLDEGNFTTFDPDKTTPGHGKAAQDYLGVHVGTPRAAAERNYTVGASVDNPMGSTLELRARTDKPLTGEGLSKTLGLNPEEYHLGFKEGPFTERELGYLIDDYEDLFSAQNPNFKGDLREFATKDLRRKLADEGYTHIPYINDVEDPGSTSLIMLTDRSKDSPAVLRDVRAKFDPQKITDPDLRFAEGGLTEDTMEQQMNKLFAEGGINTGSAEIDPVSGNEVPPGSMPEEVRDDIDAKLSGGEYVVPADVLRFYGVSFFEKLRKKAKEGLQTMDEDGRIGGEPVPNDMEEDDDFPFGLDELEAEGPDMGMAEGGLATEPANDFKPSNWAFGGSTFGGSPATSANQMKQFLDKNGNIVNVLYIKGKPIVDVQALGYTEYTGENTPKATGEVVESVKPSSDNSDRSDRDDNSVVGGTGASAEKGAPSWAEGVDWAGISPADAVSLGTNRMTNNFLEKGLMGVASMVNPALGLGAAGVINASNIRDVKNSIASLEAAGNTAAASELQKKLDADIGAKGPAWGFISDLITGKPFSATTTPTTTKTTTTPTIIKTTTTPTTRAGVSSAPSSVNDSGFLGSSSYAQEQRSGDSSGGKATAAANSKESVAQAQARSGSIASGKSQAAGATSPSRDIQSEAYSGKGYTQGRAKGGLIEKPKKVPAKKTSTRRKTKI